jgi:DNA-binding FrmR family transcriptional regulator
MDQRNHAVPVPNRDEMRRRLRRIEGQLKGVLQMIDEGKDCKVVVEQLAAVKNSFDSAAMSAVVALAQCTSSIDGAAPVLTNDEFSKLAKTLA